MISEGSRVIPRAPVSGWSSQRWSSAVVKSHLLAGRVTENEGKGASSNSFQLFSWVRACCRSSQVASTRYLRSNTVSVQHLPRSRPAPSGNYSSLLRLTVFICTRQDSTMTFYRLFITSAREEEPGFSLHYRSRDFQPLRTLLSAQWAGLTDSQLSWAGLWKDANCPVIIRREACAASQSPIYNQSALYDKRQHVQQRLILAGSCLWEATSPQDITRYFYKAVQVKGIIKVTIFKSIQSWN